SFADMYITDVTLLIDQIQRRPIIILIGLPGGAVVILRNGIFDLIAGDGFLQNRQIGLVRKFREMIANDDQSLVFIFGIPVLQRRHHVLAIDAAKRPHFDDNHLAA